uniref:MADF domain-containing protein n=1 Tax=Rhodnius prolixus TaxID=13249 RepID=T1HAA3_RHOPR
MSEKRWTEEQTVQFVERYKQLETLWNVKSGLYKNKHARESALKELVKFMNIDGFGIEEAKNKIRSLRATYIGERNKIDRSVSNGAEEDLLYDSQKKGDAGVLTGSQQTELMVMCSPPPISKIEPPDSPISAPSHCEEKNTYTYVKPIKRPRPQPQEPTGKELKNVSENIHRKGGNPFDDECDIFGEYVSVQLKQLALEERIVVQREITDLLTNARLSQIRTSHSPYSDS